MWDKNNAADVISDSRRWSWPVLILCAVKKSCSKTSYWLNFVFSKFGFGELSCLDCIFSRFFCKKITVAIWYILDKKVIGKCICEKRSNFFFEKLLSRQGWDLKVNLLNFMRFESKLAFGSNLMEVPNKSQLNSYFEWVLPSIFQIRHNSIFYILIPSILNLGMDARWLLRLFATSSYQQMRRAKTKRGEILSQHDT